MAIQSLAIIIFVLAVFLVAGVPISYAIGISALAAILQMVTLDVSVLTAAQRTFVGMSKFSLTAIPFFVLAGNLMNQGGIAKRLVDFVLAILGKLPGALLVTNVGANALFGAISGSASAAAAAVGSMVQEGEDKQGYERAVCAATNGASAPSGLLIPPSNALSHILWFQAEPLWRPCSWRATYPEFYGRSAVSLWQLSLHGKKDIRELRGNLTGRTWARLP